jgi:hypothetical protein
MVPAEGAAAVAPGEDPATPSVVGSNAASPAEMVCIPDLKSGLALRSLSKLHILAPPHVRLHFGFSHLPGLHFHEHCGSAHLLSHPSAHTV